MLNLGAAFDTINHNIDRNTIVNCLENTFLIRDLARTQVVTMNDINSSLSF